MAEASVASNLVEGLLQSIIQQANRLSRWQDELRGIEDELEKMVAELKRVESPNRLPKLYAVQIRDLIFEAEDFIVSLSAARKRSYAKQLKIISEKITENTGKLKSFADRLPEVNLGGSDKLGLSQVRRLIYYFLLFPANFQVPTRRLVVLWVAEGLIRDKDVSVNRSVEDIAENYLDLLIKEEVVVVTKNKLNGKVQACMLKDGIRETWLMEAKNANFFQSRTGVLRRVVDHTGTNDASFTQINGNPNISRLVPNCGDVVSFLSFDAQEGNRPGEAIGDFLDKCILARRFAWLSVLDLERVFRPKLPKTLGKLIRLKYLGLRWTFLQDLPNFVDKLLELQVLDVKHTYISVLPSSIWSMKDLRHLYLSEAFRTRFPDRPLVVLLADLQTLWGAFIDEDTCVTEGLDTLLKVRKLGLSCGPKSSRGSVDMSKQLKAVDVWISKLEHLETLRLKSRDKDGNASDLHLSTLRENKRLSTVYLLGKLNRSVFTKMPESLTYITLSGSELEMDPMELLGSLTNLQILRLLAQSVLPPKIRCPSGSFPQLKVLYIWKLENLEEWKIVEDGSFPCLEELEIRSCPNLKKLPDELQHVTKLEKLKLTNMREEFVEEIKVRQPQLWAKSEHDGGR